jgi:carbamoyl-phosphate synthase small subunit
MKARLVLEDGLVLEGSSFGCAQTRGGEVVFNTSMTGYQETLTDPSYSGQILVLTTSQVGNVGVNTDDQESDRVQVSGMAIRDLTEPSNYRSQMSLGTYLAEASVPGISGIDTRKLVKHLRVLGTMRGVISTELVSENALVDAARAIPSMEGCDLASLHSTKNVYRVAATANLRAMDLRTHAATSNPKRHVVAYDYGLKKAMIEELALLGCDVTVVPAWHSAEATLALAPDGVLLTNGPGDPAAHSGSSKSFSARCRCLAFASATRF